MWNPYNNFTWLESVHRLQFDDVPLVEAEQTFVIRHETLQGNHMA